MLYCFLILYVSKAQPTVSSNEFCQIPFEYKSREYNYCFKGPNTYKCQVALDKYETCKIGQFLWTRSSITENFEASFSKNLSFERRLGFYEVRCHIFLFSPKNDEYETKSDRIQLSIQFQNSIQILNNIELSQKENNQNKWIQTVASFELNNENRNNISVFFLNIFQPNKEKIGLVKSLLICQN